MESRQSWWNILLIVVLVGLSLRAFHYLRDPAMWHDEAAAVVNVLEKSWGELLGPLYWAEAAPPLFLWLTRAVVLVLGDSTLALRLVPFLASCLMVPLFAYVAWRTLPPVPAVVATVLIAVSDRLLWHACEAKPYALDALLAVGLLALHQAGKTWRLEWLLLVHLLLAPVILWLSYPGAFLLGASLVVLLPEVVTTRRFAPWMLYVLWTLVVFVAFAALVAGPARAQRCGPMEACWVNHFPPYAKPAMLPVWVVASTMEVVRYCFMPLGTGLSLLVVVGLVAWLRAGRADLVVLCVLPLGLALVASFLKQYPYGASRLEVFASAGLALLIGAGLMPTWNWLAARQRYAPALVAGLLLACVGLTAFRVFVPWYRQDASGATAHVLARMEPDDVIFGNKWEHLYYFRSLGRKFTLVENRDERPQPHSCEVGTPDDVRPPGRCWILVADEVPATRAAPMQSEWFRQRRLLGHHTFPGTDVYLIDDESR